MGNQPAGRMFFNEDFHILQYCDDTSWIGMSQQIPNQDVTDSLVGWWRLDEGAGTTANDSSGNGFNATLTNMEVPGDWVTNGRVNGALDVDGGDEGPAIIDHNGALTMANETEMTMMVWVKPTGDVNYGAIINMESGSDDPYVLALKTGGAASARGIAVDFDSTGAGGGGGFIYNFSPVHGTWYHIAVTWDQGDTRTYLDGELVDQRTIGGGAIDDHTGFNDDFYIGYGDNSDFIGEIDDVRIYERALTASEIQSVYRTSPIATRLGWESTNGNELAYVAAAFQPSSCEPHIENVVFDSMASSGNSFTLSSYTVPTLIDGMLFVVIASEDNDDANDGVPSSVTFNSTAMTEAITVTQADGDKTASIYYLGNPTASTGDVVVTTTGTVEAIQVGAYTATCLTNQAPIDTQTATADSGSTSIATEFIVPVGSLIVDSFEHGGSEVNNTISTGSQHILFQQNSNNASSSQHASFSVSGSCGDPFGRIGKPIYSKTHRSPRYCDSYDWVDMGAYNYVPQAVTFDGSDDYLLRGSDLTGNANSKLASGSFWIKNGELENNTKAIFRTNGGTFQINLGPSGDSTSRDLVIEDFGTALEITVVDAFTDLGWHHVAFSFDLSDTNKRHVFIDGVSASLTVTEYVDSALSFTATDHSLGAAVLGNAKLRGDLADFWLDFGTYIDLSDPNNLRKFYNGGPVFLGEDGRKPTGAPPILFFSGDSLDWHTNKGTGGGFTENGALGAAIGPNGGDAPRVVQISPRTSSGSSVLMSGVTAGNALVVLFQNTSSAVRTWQTSDDVEGAWSNEYQLDAPGSFHVYAAYFLNHTGGNVTVTTETVAFSETGSYNVLEIEGVDTFDSDIGWHTFVAEGGLIVDPVESLSPGLATPDNSITLLSVTHNASAGSHEFTESGWSEVYDSGSDDFSAYRIDTLGVFGLKGTIDVSTAREAGVIGFTLKDSAGARACANPTRKEGTMVYNTDFNVMQYCDGEDWQAIGK